MNLFATSDSPYQSAYDLPDKLVVKMALENAQMLAANFSEEFLNYGNLTKKDGGHYKVTHKNHPCTIWGRECPANTAWMIVHGLAICAEYHRRYGKIHACLQAHLDAKRLFERNGGSLSLWPEHTYFMRAINAKLFPEIRDNWHISTTDAYRQYMHRKHYAAWNKIPSSKPTWWNDELFNFCNNEHNRTPVSV